jgi:hypothetical protein
MPRANPPSFPNLDALIANGEITIGQMYPIGGVAVATDGHNSLAMLRQRPGESLLEVMLRLDEAVKEAVETDAYTDEINTPAALSSKRR